MSQQNRGAENPKAIAHISVDRLFGTRTYVIPPPTVDPKRTSSLLLLYGDNGSGKTTVLRMLYSLLSPSRKGGFKSFLARTPFASFSVSFADGTTLAAVRSGSELVGSFELSLTYPDSTSIVMPMIANSDNTIGLQPGEQEREYPQFLARVRELGIALYYLSDDRRLQILHRPDTSTDEEEDLVLRYSRSGRMVREHVRTSAFERLYVDDQEPRGLSLQPSIEAFEAWTRQHALRASNRGEGNTNTIYADLIRRITSAYGPRVEPSSATELDDLRKRLAAIAARSRSFVEFGLISQPPVDELVSEMSRVDDRSQPIVSRVLAPYIEGLEARLNALQELRDVLTTIVQNLNDLYTGKTVTFTLRRGLRVVTEDGGELVPEFLSSGEKQLLVLLCNTVIARDQTSIFVIDEPELSLNVKWQRKLVRTLLEGVAGSAVQFILATHSIELLSAYSDNVVKLESREWRSLNAAQSAS